MKALIIEPNKHYQAVLNVIMQTLGIDYINSSSALDARNQFNTSEFDVITISYYLENKNYKELVKEIKNQKKLKTVPIYLITSAEESSVVNDAFQSGVTEVFFKDQIDTISASLKRVKAAKDVKFSGNVLYVEDQLSVARYVTSILEGVGFKVNHFTNLEDSKQYFDNHLVDLVVSDLLLEKGHSALSLISHIRNHSVSCSRVPILAITAFDDPARRVDTFNIGANDFISKPFYPEELIARISQIMNSERYLKSIHIEKDLIEQKALTDQLSGMKNRYGFHCIVPNTLALARRYERPVTLVFIDIDDFKSINDGFGHFEGDQIIAFMGKTIMEASREQDLATRWGGDEFVLLLYDSNTEQSLEVIKRIQNKIGAYSGGCRFSCSIGMSALISPSLDDLSEMLLRADKALFSAKISGKDKCEVYIESGAPVALRSQFSSPQKSSH